MNELKDDSSDSKASDVTLLRIVGVAGLILVAVMVVCQLMILASLTKNPSDVFTEVQQLESDVQRVEHTINQMVAETLRLSKSLQSVVEINANRIDSVHAEQMKRTQNVADVEAIRLRIERLERELTTAGESE